MSDLVKKVNFKMPKIFKGVSGMSSGMTGKVVKPLNISEVNPIKMHISEIPKETESERSLRRFKNLMNFLKG